MFIKISILEEQKTLILLIMLFFLSFFQQFLKCCVHIHLFTNNRFSLLYPFTSRPQDSFHEPERERKLRRI